MGLDVITIADAHFSPRSPVSWKVDYTEELERAVRKVFEYARKNNVKAIIWAGDIFHLKAASSNPIWFITRVIKLFKEAPCVNLGIAGNHDLKFGSMEGYSGQPIELLVESGAMTLLDAGTYLLSDTGVDVEIGGVSFQHGEAIQPVWFSSEEVKWKMAVGHYWFGRQTGQVFGEPIYGPDFLRNWAADVIVMGHHHDDQGVNYVDGKWYISPGSITRTGAHKADMERKPAVAHITFTEKEVTAKVLRVGATPSGDVIDVVKREELKKEADDLQSFIECLKVGDIEGQDILGVLDGLDVAKEVREKAKEYLELAENK